MPLVEPARIPRVALAFQNDDHDHEAFLLNALADAIERHRGGEPPDPILPRLDALLAHTRDHFAREDEAMRRSEFPAYPIHHAEHERVLAEMEGEARRFREGGDVDRLWTYVSQAVPGWFVHHIQSMDAVTGQFVAARGG
jgi:hemerythrin